MAALSKLTPRAAAIGVASAAVLSYVTFATHSLRKYRKTSIADVPLVVCEKNNKKDRAYVDLLFFKRLFHIVKILIPGWFSPEFGYLLLVALSLLARTYCDVWMIQNGTAIESAIIGRDNKLFKTHLFKFMIAMPGISTVNNILKYGLNMLKLCLRHRMTNYLYEQYLRSFTYYKMNNLDNRIANVDQLLTQDVEKFCNTLADLYSNISKPLLDILIYVFKLTNSIGVQGPAYMLMYLAFSGLILTRIRRPIGRMTVTEQRLEGEFRYVNSRLITNSEEIAFYQGNRKEHAIIYGAFQKLVDHLRNFIFFRFSMGFLDNLVAKYLATVVGYLVVSRPFLILTHPRHMKSGHNDLLEDYYRSGRMLVKLAEAIGRLVLAGREMTRLSGFTARVTELMTVLDDLNKGQYQRTMVSQQNNDKEKDLKNHLTKVSLKPDSGKIVIQDRLIKFEHVPLVTPNGDVLIEELNFEVPSGRNVLVCGPNGCGKSSLFRTLGELWPLFGGKMTKPDQGKLFYIPQRPYMTLGTLKDQIIYPDSVEDLQRKGLSEKDLEKFLDLVQLTYILEREGGWNVVEDWMDVLSGGEKQRVAMARLFYHKPQYAILDECTSAVSMDVEGHMYQYCKEVGITLFTVSHRKSLWKHHEYYLLMDGRGSYEFKKIEPDTQEFGS